MAGTTGLEPATSAVTATTWKSTDGTVSHWKYIIGNVIVYRDVYRIISGVMKGHNARSSPRPLRKMTPTANLDAERNRTISAAIPDIISAYAVVEPTARLRFPVFEAKFVTLLS